MARTPTECFITAIFEARNPDEKRRAERHPLHVPLNLANGHIERLSDLQIRECIKDLQAEQTIRKERAQKREQNREQTGDWDPLLAAIGAA